MKRINFEIGFLRDVKNIKYVLIYNKIIDRLNQANFEHEHMLDCIGLLVRHDIKRTENWGNIKYEETPEIQELHKERRKRLAGFRDLIDRLTSLKGFISERSADILQKWLKPIRPMFGSRNTLDEMLAVYEIESSVEVFGYLKDAMKEANLLQFVDELVDLNNRIADMENERREHVDTAVLGQERKLESYNDLKDVLVVLNTLIEVGKTDAELALRVGYSIDALLRRERGYVRMVDTKKQMKEGRGEGDSEEGL